MPNIQLLEETPRRVLNVFYILDTSGSMEGAPIAQLNRAMAETTDILSKQAKSNADALLKIGVMEFNSQVRWLQPKGPELMEDFIWEDLKDGGLTCMGTALTDLNKKLSRNSFLSSMTGAYLPILIFMTDGYATDDYVSALEEIRKNKWFSHAVKIGFAIGEDPDVKMISEVVGTHEAVIRTNNLETFGRLLKFASVTSTMLASNTQTSAQTLTGAEVIKQAIASGEASITMLPTITGYNAQEPDDLEDEFA